MTTAARPTFDPARGGQGRGEKDLSAISRQYSSRDLPGHTKLKYREQGQGTTDELRSRDFRKELDEREKDVKGPARRPNEPQVKRAKIDQVPAASLDADDPLEGDSSDSDDSDDDTAALLAELNKIKKERAIEQAKKEAERKQEEERIRMENILSGNPLLNYSAAGQKNDLKMAEDFDVEAMLEAPYNKSDNTSSSKHRSDKYSDKHKDKDRDSSRRRSRSRERRRSRERITGRSKELDDRRDKDRDRKDRDRDRHRDKERGERDKDKERGDRDKDKERGDHRDKDRERERERDRDKEKRSKERERSRDRGRSRERHAKREKSGEQERDSKEYRSKSRGAEPKLEELPPEERDLRTVFCMQLSQKIRAKDLEEFFSSVGKVRDVRLITCNKTRRFKGIAYIEFKDAESVPLALGLTGQKLLGIPIIVQHTQAEKNRVGNTLPNLAPKTSNGPTRLYVGSLHFNITEDMLRGIFEPFGKIDHIQLMTDPETGKSKGYGFLTFHHAADAKKAMEQLNGFELAGRPMKVGNVTERTDGGSSTRFDADELDRAGVDLGATGRLQLMFKLAEGTGLQIPPAAASVLMGTSSTMVNPQPQVAPPIATQCFMLNNMFDPATESNPSWDIEIRDDVISECNKHGGVLHVYVDKASPQGNVYCKCPTIATAVASVNSLHGRWFAGRVITAAYVPLVNYHSLFPDAMTALTLLLPTRQR